MEKEIADIQSNQKTEEKMAVLNPHLSGIILNVNGLNSPIERNRMTEWIEETKRKTQQYTAF